MRTKILFATLALATSATALAQSHVEHQSRVVAMEIRRQAAFLTPAQEQEISQHLSAIQAILRFDSAPAASYTCVSRDNDGRNPFAIAIREGINVSRLTGTTYKTEAECSQALASSRYLSGATLVCTSRDNDGAAPFALASLIGSEFKRVSRSVTRTSQDCSTLLASLRQTRDGQVIYCTSRDNDGAAPFQAVSLTPTTGAVQAGSEIFQTIAECKSFIGQ